MEEKTNQLHNMMEQLIKMVGTNNATTEELRQDITTMGAKLDKVLATQTIQGESINILAMRQLNTESEIAALKQAK